MKTLQNNGQATATKANNESKNGVNNRVYRYDWNTAQMVEIKGIVLEIGQKVRIYGYAMNWRDYVCTSEPDGRNCQNLVEIGGSHARSSWEIGLNDRSTAQVFGIGKYYDPSGERLTADEIARHLRAADIQERWNARKAENQERADEQERAELRKKWAGVLVPLADINDWKEREKQEKANVINYLKYHHPRARFTARKGRGGHYLAISWQDGPTVDSIRELMHVWSDHTFNGYEDYNEYTPDNFTRLFGGFEYSADLNRSYSAAAIERGREAFREACPELADLIGTGNAKELSRDDCDALNEWANMTVNARRDNETAAAIYEAGRGRVRNWHNVTPDYIITDYLDGLDLTPAEPATDPEKPRKSRKQAEPTESKGETSDGLTMEKYSEKATVIRGYNEQQAAELEEMGGKEWKRLKGGKGFIFSTRRHGDKLAEWFAAQQGEGTAPAAEPATLESGQDITAPAFGHDVAAIAREQHPEWPEEFTTEQFYNTPATDEHGRRIKTADEIKEQARRIECNYLAGRGSLRDTAHRLERTKGADHPDTLAAYERLQSRARYLRAAELEAHRTAGERRRAAWMKEHRPDTLEQGGEITAPKAERMKTRGEVFAQYFRILNKLTDGKKWESETNRDRADRILKALNRYADNFAKVPEIARLYSHSGYLEDGTDPAKAANLVPVARSLYMGLRRPLAKSAKQIQQQAQRIIDAAALASWNGKEYERHAELCARLDRVSAISDRYIKNICDYFGEKAGYLANNNYGVPVYRDIYAAA